MNYASTIYGLGVACLVPTLMFGCGGGSDGPARTAIHGTVTLDGIPLKTGEISFRPADGKGPTDAAQIQDGAFRLQGTSGSKLVQITSYQESTKKAPDGLPVSENIIPKEYNSSSAVTVTIPHKDALKYDLLTKPNSKPAGKK